MRKEKEVCAMCNKTEEIIFKMTRRPIVIAATMYSPTTCNSYLIAGLVTSEFLDISKREAHRSGSLRTACMCCGIKNVSA